MKNVFDAEGEIREVDPLAGLVSCWRDRSSGTLRFTRGASECGFDLDEGEVVGIASSDPRFETAAILVRAGKLSADAVERLAPQGGDPALAALQTGLLTRREWKWGEKIRAIEVLSDLLTWNDGRYRFEPNARAKAGDFRVPVPRLLLELFLRSRDRNLVDHQLGPPDQALVRGEQFEAEFPNFGLTADAESVVQLIDGRSSAAEIAERAPAEEFAVRKLLAALVTLGLVHAVPAAPVAPAEHTFRRRDEAEPAFSDSQTRLDESPEVLPAEIAEPPAADAGFEALETHISMPAAAEPEARAEHEMVDLPASGTSPLDRFEPSAGAEVWEAGPPREDSGDLWGSAPAASESAQGAEPQVSEPSGSRTGVLLGWALGILVVAVGALVVVRSRGGHPSQSLVPAPPTAAAAVTFPPPVTAASGLARSPQPASVATALPRTEVPAAPTAVATARRPAPTEVPPRAGKPAAPEAAAGKPPAVPVSQGASSEPKESWAARAARDRHRLEGDRHTRYSIQLELVCEAASLQEAWRHDRSQSMWLLPVHHDGRDCYRVFWGRYPSLEAAKKAKSGIPSYFVTARNHPAVVSVR